MEFEKPRTKRHSNNATHICTSIQMLHERLVAMTESSNDLSEFHVLCEVHVINITMKECFIIIRNKEATARGLIAAIRSSVKRVDQFDKFIVELRM